MKEKIQNDIKEAMKARDGERLTLLRGLLSELKREEIDTRQELTEERCVAILQKEIKKRRDALEFAVQAARTDLVEQNNREITTIQSYLGDQLSAEKLQEIITQLIADGADSIGKIMGPLNAQYRGKFEGKIASELAQKALQSR